MADPTYPLPDVLEALGITESTATNWTRRGYQEIDAISSGRGRARRLEIVHIVSLGIMKACVDGGVAPSRAAVWARDAVNMLDNKHFSTMTVALHPEGEHFYFDDDKPVSYPASSPDLAITINVRAIVDRLRAKLDELRQAAPAPGKSRQR